MKIYLGHASNFDYQTELYNPLQQSALMAKNEIIFPHLTGDEIKNSWDSINNCDVVIAEVSYPSTGLGIELAWALALKKPIICFYRSGKMYSRALEVVSDRFVEYNDSKDMVEKMTKELENK